MLQVSIKEEQRKLEPSISAQYKLAALKPGFKISMSSELWFGHLFIFIYWKFI